MSLLPLVALGLAMGCDASRADLLIDLKTDLVPVAEVLSARTERLGGRAGDPSRPALEMAERAFARGEDLAAGVRVAELRDLAHGDHHVRLRLLGPGGAVVVERLAIVTVRANTVATLVLTRDCRGVMCPGTDDPVTATACLGGRCVDPRCLPEAPEACPTDPECVVATDCPAPAGACAAAVCESTVCLSVGSAAMCAPGGYCDPDVGCVGGLVDAGMDSGVDASMDAGMDASMDAGMDASADAGMDGPVDAGCGPGQILVPDAGCLADDPSLVDLVLSAGPIAPIFAGGTTDYTLGVALGVGDTTVTPTAAMPAGVTILVNGVPVSSGTPSPPLVLDWATTVRVDVTAESGAMRTYQVLVTRAAEGYLKPPMPVAGNRFGYSAEISGDGNVLAVLAISEPAVHVFRRGGGVWMYEGAVTTDSYSAEGDRLSISRDGSTIIVGTFLELEVIRQVTGVWQIVQTLRPAPPNDTVRLRWGVTLSADGTVIAGANATAVGTEGQGMAFTFRFDGMVWQPGEVINPPVGTAAELFGWDLAMSDDGTVLAVGAPNTALAGGFSCGSVHILRWDGAVWQPEGFVWNMDDVECDGFGDDLSISSDGNVLVTNSKFESSDGSSPADDSVPSSGAAFVYRNVLGAWVDDGFLKAPNVGSGDQFGRRVAISGDGLHIAVGAWAEDSPPGDFSADTLMTSGAAYLYLYRGGSWMANGSFKATNADAGDTFGSAVSLDQDGSTFVVGAQEESGISTDPGDNSAGAAGAVYIFE